MIVILPLQAYERSVLLIQNNNMWTTQSLQSWLEPMVLSISYVCRNTNAFAQRCIIAFVFMFLSLTLRTNVSSNGYFGGKLVCWIVHEEDAGSIILLQIRNKKYNLTTLCTYHSYFDLYSYCNIRSLPCKHNHTTT